MGYRLHYSPHYNPEWRGGYFNWGSEEWGGLFRAMFHDNGWQSEDGTSYEVSKEDLIAYIAELKKHPRTRNEFMTDYKNNQVAEALQEIVDGSKDDYIRLEWF